MRKYKIQPTTSDFVTGKTSDGRQVLFGLLYPYVDAVIFDKKGSFLERKKIPVLDNPPADPSTMWTEDFKRAASNSLRQFKDDMSLTIQPISVQAFAAHDIQLQDVPEHYLRFLDDPKSFEPVEARHADWRREIEQWKADGKFVLLWGKDYWLNAEGKVIAT